MKKTYQEIANFIGTAQAYQADEKRTKETKFTYALRKVVKSCQKLWESYIEQREDIDVEHAATDPKTHVILRDEQGGGISYTKDGMRARQKALRELFQQEVTVTSFGVATWPADLTDTERDAFEDFVPLLQSVE